MSSLVDPAAAANCKVRELRPPRGWHCLDLRALWEFRELMFMLAARDIRVRYKQTALGVLWAVIQPVGLMVVITLLRRILGMGGAADPVLVFAGLLPWTFFAAGVNSSTQSLVSNAHMLRKVYFPRLVLPLAALGAPLLDLALAWTVLLGLMAWYGTTPGISLLLLIPWTVAALLVAAGVGILLSAMTVFYRDVRHVVPMLLQVWFFLTPVIYQSSDVPEQYRWLLNLNPVAAVVEGFRAAALGGTLDLGAWGLSCAAGVGLLMVAVSYFQWVQSAFADAV